MKKVLDHGYVKLIESWGHGEDGEGVYQMLEGPMPDDNEIGIIEAARMSTGKGFVSWEPYEDHPKGDAGLLAYLFNSKPQHGTPFEMAGMTIEVQAPIFVFREWHRHRTQSYNELSARYTKVPDDKYLPTMERVFLNGRTDNKQAGAAPDSLPLTEDRFHEGKRRILAAYEAAQDAYDYCLANGWPKELARLPVPVANYSRMRASANLRNWYGFLSARLDPKAQYEIREFAQAVSEIIESQFPRTWELFINRKKE